MKVGIIGGGISGVVCGIIASQKNEVTILERNDKLLKKLLITGNGKCNYFNSDQNINNYNSTSNLENIITENNINKVKQFYENIGIIPKIKNGYYYPTSNTATSVKESLNKELENNKVKVINNYLVKSVKKIADKFIINDDLEFDKIVISTGSRAYPKTGSDGIGYKLLEDFNLNIIEPLPALTPLISEDKYKWSGLRTDVSVSLFEDNKFIKEERGEIQLTDYGVSGICIFNLSGFIAKGLNNKKTEVLKINFLPFIENPKQFLIERNNKLKNRTIMELLEGILNYKLVHILLNKTGIKDDDYLNNLNENKFAKLIENLTEFKLKIIDTKKYDVSQVCSGGLDLNEINLKTMESKIDNLYVIGELLDVDGLCGGYNITFATLSGILAGENI